MKTTLGVVIAAAAMMFGAGLANAAVSGNVAALRSLSAQSSTTQTIVYVHHHYHHRHCSWSHQHRHCRWN
jgi:hypothetical protein